MKHIFRFLQQYFGFSRSETRGFAVLVLIMAAIVAFLIFYKPTTQEYNPEKDQQELDSLVSLLETHAEALKTPAPKLNLQPFNPNKLTQAQWQEIGLPEFLAKRILNYRAKVGDFKSKEQLGKIYGLPDSVFRQLYPYIQLPTQAELKSGYAKNTSDYASANRSYPASSKTYRLEPFDLNTADTTELKKIRGIGGKLSTRIITFREKLGGFHSVEQLSEVFGLSPEVIDSLKKYTFVTSGYAPAQISLNQVTYEALKQHPYLKAYVAKAIIAYREQHGAFKQLEDIRKIKVVDEALYEKLKPYLSL